MRFGIDVGGELELKLHQAVLVYRNEQRSRHMATVHNVMQGQNDRAPILGAGQLLTTAVLRELTWALRTACPIEILPERVLARTAELLAWWAPATMRPMFFRAGSELSELSGCRFPHPGLLFVVSNSALYVRALRLSQRPGGETALFAAPYWNVRNDGSVCAGTMRAPKSTSVASIRAWEDAFFQSEFTHPGFAGRLTKRRGGTTALWKSLADKQEFPIKTLLETEGLGAYLEALGVRQ
jgi:PRTRC genetic system protein B